MTSRSLSRRGRTCLCCGKEGIAKANDFCKTCDEEYKKDGNDLYEINKQALMFYRDRTNPKITKKESSDDTHEIKIWNRVEKTSSTRKKANSWAKEGDWEYWGLFKKYLEENKDNKKHKARLVFKVIWLGQSSYPYLFKDPGWILWNLCVYETFCVHINKYDPLKSNSIKKFFTYLEVKSAERFKEFFPAKGSKKPTRSHLLKAFSEEQCEEIIRIYERLNSDEITGTLTKEEYLNGKTLNNTETKGKQEDPKSIHIVSINDEKSFSNADVIQDYLTVEEDDRGEAIIKLFLSAKRKLGTSKKWLWMCVAWVMLDELSRLDDKDLEARLTYASDIIELLDPYIFDFILTDNSLVHISGEDQKLLKETLSLYRERKITIPDTQRKVAQQIASMTNVAVTTIEQGISNGKNVLSVFFEGKRLIQKSE